MTPLKLSEINIRDPYILPYNEKYYLYGSRVGTPEPGMTWGVQTGFDVYTSRDLENWAGPQSVFEMPKNFWADRDAWAPEVHIHNGRFYMLASFKASGGCRGSSVLVADAPEGPFLPTANAPVTPMDWECLDGTLYVDDSGTPHMIFCHEWLQVGNGTVCEIVLSDDLSQSVSAPRVLWTARDWSAVRAVGKQKNGYVTDGPFLHRTKNGKLLCIWSTMGPTGYVELVAESDNGRLDGNWNVLEQPLFSKNGGHGMIFRAFNGALNFIMHQPNSPVLSERPVILPLQENTRTLTLII